MTSVDGYIEDVHGGFGWAEPDDEVHQFVNDLLRPAVKVVFSTTLDGVATRRTTLERSFDVDRIRERKARATRPLVIGGADLAAHAFAAGLVDEYHLILHPVVVGGGRPAIAAGVSATFSLEAVRTFAASGVVSLRYRSR